MFRKEKVYDLLKKQCLKIKNIKGDVGFSADFIAKQIGITRNNASFELNNLYREGRVEKIRGRPTLYLDKEWCVKNNYFAGRVSKNTGGNAICTDCFNDLIGHDGSLSSYIKQVQAAILYPPKGLATLILGETGTGKTTFARHIYRFALDNRPAKEDMPYVIFNCADYANNPQLLMTILFGSVKGAYTGSESDRMGLVDKAAGGILFLDEVHRLPPEGQEMLFTMIDSNRYRRLGDVSEREADVLIIAATTEDPKSALLETFLRRFPIVIKLPSLKERNMKERLEIISGLFNQEALRVGVPIKVSKDILNALLLYLPQGNVGALKSTIELISSRGYLDHLISGQDIYISLKYLPENVMHGLLQNNEDKRKASELIGFDDVIFHGGQKVVTDNNRDPYDFSFKIYEYLDSRNAEYKKTGLNKDIIACKLYKDLEDSLIKFCSSMQFSSIRESGLSKFLNFRVVSIVKILSQEVLEKYNYHIKENTLIALAFHINSLFNRRTRKITTINLENIKQKHAVEFDIAHYIVERLKRLLKFRIGDDEVGFICMILYLTSQEDKTNKKVGIIVIAHGESTASSMASVANKLLNTDNVRAINMGLDDNSSDVLKSAIMLAKELDEGKGILIVVDMGSLKGLGPIIEKQTGIKVMTIDNASTPMLLEAAHKSMMPYMDLKDIAISVLELEKNLINTTLKEISGRNDFRRIIFTVCSTGEGTAVYLKDNIEKIFVENGINGVQVIEMNISDMASAVENMRKIAGDREIIAVAGSINPDYPGVPFFNLMDFVTGNGLERIALLASQNRLADIKSSNNSRKIVYGAVSDALDENLNFLSGKKMMPYIDKYTGMVEEWIGSKLSNHDYTIISMHLAYALEKAMFNGKQNENDVENRHLSGIVKEIYDDFRILLDDDDVRIVDILKAKYK
jgi:transcriptional regulator with AAA-type ATPase domain/transcriptional regulatory protein LevR